MRNIPRKKKKNKGLFLMMLIVITIALIFIVGIIISAPGRQEIKNLVINSVNFNNLRDGTYVGDYIGTKDHTRDTQIEVTITGGKISNIKILKGALKNDGEPIKLNDGLTIENLFSDVINSQSLKVDAISGATLTSKTHLKALENALKQAEID